MLLIILVCCLFLLLIFLGYVAIKIFGFTRGVKSIYSFVSFFRKEERYDTVNSANAQAYNAECPFCLKKTDSPVMASCNHAYCGTTPLIQASVFWSTMLDRTEGSWIAPPANSPSTS